jgi:hypothetical protein
MTNRDSTYASRRTPFTVHEMHPKGRHLHPFDWIRWRGFWRAGRHGERLAGGVAQLHMHLGPRRTRRPALRGVAWAEEWRPPSGAGSKASTA